MKPEIIPAILAKSKKEFFEKLDIASAFSKTVQIDIMDGLFVENRTPKALNDGRWFGEYVAYKEDESTPDVELHLMVMDPWKIIREWQEYPDLKRVIWHIELPLEHGELIEVVHGLEIEAGLAINPDTDLKSLFPFVSDKSHADERADETLIMGVVPGHSGQEFKPSVLKKISALRKKHKKIKIAVDGGINQKTAPKILKAGAGRLNAAGAIFLAPEAELAFRNLEKAKAQ